MKFVCMIVAALLMAGPAYADDLARALNILVYNTHGLPGLIAQDKPKKRFPEIAALASGYDLALLQEDFAHHDLLVKNLNGDAAVFKGEDTDNPPCLFHSNSGLTLVSNLARDDWSASAQFHEFNACAGYLAGANDCFAQKGFLIVHLQSKAGQQVTVVNTHLDAGDRVQDRQARAEQLDHIASVLERDAAGRAIILAGDLNLDWYRPEDQALLFSFRDRLGLTRAGYNLPIDRGWVALDYIYVRDGDAAQISVVGFAEDQRFENEDGPLSDHPALSVTVTIQ